MCEAHMSVGTRHCRGRCVATRAANAPEIGGGSVSSALALLEGGLMMLRDRRR